MQSRSLLDCQLFDPLFVAAGEMRSRAVSEGMATSDVNPNCC